MISIRERENIIGEKQLLREIITQSIDKKQSFSLWKTPGINQKNLIVCGAIKKVDEFVLENGDHGFAFASFLPSSPKYLFPADDFYQFENDVQVNGPEITSNGNKPLSHSVTNLTISRQAKINTTQSSHKQEKFIELVNNGLTTINESKFEKVVVSRYSDIPLTNEFDLLNAFYSLCEKHPDALVSLVSSPETGTWLGATPELLVSVDEKNRFKTIALAGTQSYHSDVNLKSVAWTQKEIEEQALVCRYIINCFKKIRLREFEEHGPRTMVAGNLMHLKTEYEVDMAATNFPQLGSVMLKLLHPTSAVCGMPFESALNFIQENEGYDREFYSGYLGPVQINNCSKIYVNLRCMQVHTDHVRIYAGAGITSDSIAEKELEETEIKMLNLRNLVIS